MSFLGAVGRSGGVGRVILDQMGGVGRLSAMAGAKDFVTFDEPESGVMFRFSGNAKIGNKVRIVLTPADEYDMEFWYVRGTTAKKIAVYDSLYNYHLKGMFERHTGLLLSL